MTTTIDRTWSEATTFIVVWPLDMPDRSTIVAACRKVAGTAPHHVIASDSADVDALVAEAMACAAVTDLGPVAFMLIHSPHGMVGVHPHERGDVAFSTELRALLLSAMGVGTPPAVLLDRQLSLRRCGAALVVHWARDLRRPARALRFLRVRRASIPRPARSDPPPAVEVVEPRTTLVVVPADEIAELRASLAGLGIKVSASMALLYAVWSAHAPSAHATGRLQIMVGLRQYSHLNDTVHGNLVGRLVLRVPAGSPAGLAELGRTVRAWTDSGEPLLLHAAKVAAVRIRSAAAAVRGRPRRQWESSWREGGVDVVWSDCGASTGLSETTARWSPDHPAVQRQAFMLARPVVPTLGVNVSWVGSSACLGLSYDASKTDIGPVLAVLKSPAPFIRSMTTVLPAGDG